MWGKGEAKGAGEVPAEASGTLLQKEGAFVMTLEFGKYRGWKLEDVAIPGIVRADMTVRDVKQRCASLMRSTASYRRPSPRARMETSWPISCLGSVTIPIL